jgi:hypothetical protein
MKQNLHFAEATAMDGVACFPFAFQGAFLTQSIQSVISIIAHSANLPIHYSIAFQPIRVGLSFFKTDRSGRDTRPGMG